MSWELARQIADAVLYEGYVLYPYRPSSAKNQFRWQFGVVAPRAWSEAGGEPWEMQTECLIEPDAAASVDVGVRFLQITVRNGEWEEGVERTLGLPGIRVEELLSGEVREHCFHLEGEWPISGKLQVAAERAGACVKLRVRVENLTEISHPEEMERSIAMRHSLVGTHTLLAVTGGRFVSLMDPPAEARAAAAGCRNLHTWPVLVGREGEHAVMLSSPIILQDYPAIAPESQASFFDATEIDEMLTLRVMTLTDEEKREASAADERARQIIERCDNIPPEMFERLHGAIRSLEPSSLENFFNPPGENPEENKVTVRNGTVSKGARVRLAPLRHADTMDLFLAGRTAKVRGVHRDVEDRVYVAVTVDDDPAAELHGRYGRFYYFYPDELELLECERKET